MSVFPSFLACYQVFELFAKHAVKVDLISTSETNLSIAIHESVETSKVVSLPHPFLVSFLTPLFHVVGPHTSS